MAIRVGNQALKLKTFVKSEIIWRNIPRICDHSFRVNQYKETLKHLNNFEYREAPNFLYFPRNTFLKYPTSVVKSLIDDSKKIFSEKDLVNVNMYNSVIKSYLENLIDFDVIDLLDEMNQKQIQFNGKTFELLIELYSEDGNIDSLEAILASMKMKGLKLNHTTKMKIIRGYIISGQPDKSKAFIQDNNLPEKSLDVLINEAKGYASFGNVNKVIDIIDQMNQEKLKPSENLYFTFYYRLAKANASDSDLDKILNLVGDPDEFSIYICALSLNKAGLFNCALKLVERFHDKFTSSNISSDLLTSFNSKDCPSATYKNLLALLLRQIDSRVQRHLFSNISYEEAVQFARRLPGDAISRPVMSSLLNRAIQERSVELICDALSFGFSNWTLRDFNVVLVIEFIPAILQSGMASSGQEILNLLQASYRILLPVVLIDSLCKGNFSEYNDILSKSMSSEIFFNVKTRPLAIEITRNLSLQEISRLVVEARKAFHEPLVNKLLVDVLIEKIISSSKAGNPGDIAESVKLAENLGATFTAGDLRFMMKIVPEHSEALKSLPRRIDKIQTDKSIVNQE